MRIPYRLALILVCYASGAALAVDPPTTPPAPAGLPMTWLDHGMQAATGLSRQLQCPLSEDRPAELKAVPDGLLAPRFGVIKVGPDTDSQSFFVCLDQPKGQPSRLFVDLRATGELTPVKEWVRDAKSDACSGSFVLQANICGATRAARFTCATVDTKDAGMVWARNKLLVGVDCGWIGDLKLGAKTFHACIHDLSGQLAFHHAVPKRGTTLLVDLNSDKRFDRTQETFDLGAPFTTGGASWRFSAVNAQGVPVIEPIDLTRQRIEVGKPAPVFKVSLMDGRDLQFPRDFAGKLVFFDFWAMWCPYCVDEFPGLIQAHKELADKGLEIIGVNIDGPDKAESIKRACERAGITWEQVYSGLGWDSPLAMRFEVGEIPYGVLLDGTTGVVLALGVRADDLRDAVAAAKRGK